MRQYIGARYTPNFLGTYDATTSYEALSVVDNGMGTSYISNKPVPAGTPLSDTTYWSIYGASSGAIINLQNQVNNLYDREGKRIIIIGDSYGTGYSPDGDTTSFVSLIKSEYNLSNSQIINASLYNAAFSRSPYFIDGLTAIEPVNNPETITDIYVVGGYNDHGASDSDISSGMSALATHIRSTYPHAQIHVVFAAKSFDLNAVLKAQLIALQHTYYTLSQDLGMSFSNVSNMLMSITDMSTDKYHPNQTGQNWLARAIGNVIFGVNCQDRDCSETNPSLTPTPEGTNTISTHNFAVTIHRFPTTTNLRWQVILTGSFTLTGGAWNAIFSFDVPSVVFPTITYDDFEATMRVKDSNNKYRALPCVIGFDNNKFYIKPLGVNDSGTGFFSGTVSEIYMIKETIIATDRC